MMMLSENAIATMIVDDDDLGDHDNCGGEGGDNCGDDDGRCLAICQRRLPRVTGQHCARTTGARRYFRRPGNGAQSRPLGRGGRLLESSTSFAAFDLIISDIAYTISSLCKISSYLL